MTHLNVLFLLKKLQDFFFFFCRCCSVTQSCLTLFNPMDYNSTPGFLVPHYLPSVLKLMSIESVMPYNHLILCCPLLLLPSIFPSIKVFFSDLALCIRWPKYCSFSFTISPSNIQSWYPLGLTGLISLKSKGFSQDYWSGETFHSLGDLLGPEIESGSPALQADSLLFEPPRKTILSIKSPQISLLLIYLLLYNFIALCFNNKGTTKLILSS